MSDLVGRLRYEPPMAGLQEDAADEIERLRAELDALKAHSGKCLGGLFRDSGDMVNFFVAGQVTPVPYQYIKSVVGDLPMARQVPVFASPIPPAPSVPSVTEDQRERVMDAIAEALGDAYDCTRHWSAWSYGTMGPDDFTQVAEDDARLAEIADAAIGVMLAAAPNPEDA